MRAVRMVTLALLSTSVIGMMSGCAIACTEIGFSNRVDVTLEGGRVSGAHSVELCFDDMCTAGSNGGSDTWVFQLGLAAPATPTIVVVSADGSTIARDQLSVKWTETVEPNGPGCQNSSTADPVIFTG